jgi:uncharacterized protein YeeX (DUF496 family)
MTTNVIQCNKGDVHMKVKSDSVKSVRMPTYLSQWIDDEASFEGLSTNAFIINILREKMEDIIDLHDIKEALKDPNSHEFISREEMMNKYEK